MNILLLGGTRFAGRAVAARLLRDGHAVAVSSRRPEGAPAGACVLAGERSAVLAAVAPRAEFDVVLDFTAYDAAAARQALETLPGASYVFISTTWLAKLDAAMDAATPVPSEVRGAVVVPEITARYLAGKAEAERVVLAARAGGRRAAVLRLPILTGADDHTGRIDFYRRRVRDGEAVLLVDGGRNGTNLLWAEDAAAGIAAALSTGVFARLPIVEALPDGGHTVADVVREIAEAERKPLRTRSVSASWLQEHLPDYLAQEPWWRERSLAPTAANLFALTASKPRPMRDWIAELCAGRAPRVETDGLRERELRLLKAEAAA